MAATTSSAPKSNLGPLSKDELACIYSALILADDDIPITADKIQTILTAAEVQVESIWPSLFARALQGINIKELISSLGALGGGGGGGMSAAAPGGAAAGAEAGAEEKKKEEPQPEEEDSSDEDFGLGLFD